MDDRGYVIGGRRIAGGDAGALDPPVGEVEQLPANDDRSVLVENLAVGGQHRVGAELENESSPQQPSAGV